MALDPRTPVLIGVGQFTNRVDEGAEELEPVHLMAEALRAAADDAGAPAALRRVDVLAVVQCVSWRYTDPGRLVANAVGAEGATWFGNLGGNTPQSLVNRLCAAVMAGEVRLGAVVGAEAFRTRMSARRQQRELAWTHQDAMTPTWADTPAPLWHDGEAARGVLAPAEMYPMFETALWHDSHRSLPEHLAAVGELWSRFSAVAAANPFAWRRAHFTADEITTATADNRMVSFPYTKRMVANPDVDMAAGCLVASVEMATALGVPRDRWVFPLSGTDGADPFMSERESLIRSAAIRVAGRRALELAGVDVDDVAHVDLYSCFPSAVQIAARELGLSLERTPTVYGGLPFAGGPWNNPVSHAIAAMVGVLRADPGSIGLVTANGGNIQKHAFGVYSTEPRGGFVHDRPQAAIDAAGRRAFSLDVTGRVTIEGWTVVHGRDGLPQRFYAATLSDDGVRAWGLSTDPDVMARGVSDDVTGDEAHLAADGTLRLGD